MIVQQTTQNISEDKISSTPTENSQKNTKKIKKIQNPQKKQNDNNTNHNNNNNNTNNITYVNNQNTSTNHSYKTPKFKNYANFQSFYIPFNNSPKTCPIIGIASHNIQGGHNKKIDDILNYMFNNNIHIFHICETKSKIKITSNDSAQTTQKNFKITNLPFIPITNTNSTIHFFSIDNFINDDLNRGAGNSIIISELLKNHLTYISSFNGRIISLQFTFPKNITLNIIGTYLPPLSTEAKYKNVMPECLKELRRLTSLQSWNLHKNLNILLGDLNIDWNKDSARRTHAKTLAQLLKEKHLKDCFHTLLTETEHTFHSGTTATTIDYIYGNKNVINNIANLTNNNSNPFYSSDHNIISCYLATNNIFNTSTQPKNLQWLEYANETISNNHKRHLNETYTTKKPECWNDYTQQLNTLLSNTKLQFFDLNHDDRPLKHIDEKTSFIINHVIKICKKTLVKKKIHIETTSDTIPHIIKQIKNQKKYIDLLIIHTKNYIDLKIMKQVSTTPHPLNAEDFTRERTAYLTQMDKHFAYDKFWQINTLTKLRRLCLTYNHNYEWPLTITEHTIEHITYNLTLLKSLLNDAFNKESSKWQLNQINNAITAREHNYKLSPTKLLNSILERTPNKINLEKIIIHDPNTSDTTLVTNPKTIEKETIQHFQTVGNTTNNITIPNYSNIHDLPPSWQEIYQPKETPESERNAMLSPISQEELAAIIKDLPNNKAAGPNGLIYEIWKKFPKNHYDLIINLFNDILKLETIPSRWQEALLYPIPKPEYWNCDLSKTRPIILLDTLRKIFTKVLTQRLQRYLTKTSVLQKTNQAGLQGSSTMEIIFKIQTIIDYHKNTSATRSPFYIMIQDLSKAYDRVNLSLLKLSLNRINLPNSFTTVIINLFNNHKNSIILPTLLSENFDLKMGIIQGEVCSPLLWITYYDPLFEAINKLSNQGITLNASIPKSIHDPNDKFIQQENIKLLGYLDDTTWTNDSLSNLATSLKIADEFYSLANIKINKNKCKLLTNDAELIHVASIQLPFGDETVKIEITKNTNSIRILGAYFNAFNNHKQTFNKIKRIVSQFVYLLKPKKLSNDMITYVIESVLYPRLEYLTQNLFLPVSIITFINTRLRSLYKHITTLAKSTMNEIIHSPLFRSPKNFVDHMAKAKASLLLAQANSPLTENCFKILTILSQLKFWYPTSPFKLIQSFKKPHASFNTFESIIFLLRHFNIEFNTNWSYHVKGGTSPICDYFINTPKFFTYIKSLKKKQIIFLDQITHPDGVFLKTWNEIKYTLPAKTGHITYPTVKNAKRPKTESTTHRNIVKGGNEWVSFWDPITRNLTIGRIIEKNYSNKDRATAYIEHWIPIIPTTQSDITPRKVLNALRRCEGCKLHYPQFIGSFSYSCVILKLISNILKIKVTNSPTTPGFHIVPLPTTPTQKKQYFLTLPLSTLKAQALADYASYITTHNTRDHNLNTSTSFNIVNNSCKFLDLFFLDSHSITTLNRIAYLLTNCTNISFYTDGSCITDHSTKSLMGIGWAVTDHPSIPISSLQFSCKAHKFPSSTKAEALALTSALAVCLEHSKIVIYTDSKCIIDTFYYVRLQQSTRKILKVNNFLIWKAISKIIFTHKLDVELRKVKAHSNDQFNDMADKLAKDGTTSNTYIDINPATVNLNAYYTWNLPKAFDQDNVHPLVIDRNIRHAIADITNFQAFNKFLAHYRIEDIRRASFKNAIDWKWTKEWFNHNPVDNMPTSRKLTKFRAWQMKNCSNSLPTMDILQKYNPDLFSNVSLCWHCRSVNETNQHLWLCPTILKNIKPLVKQLTLRFIAIIRSAADTLQVDISNTFKTNPIFSWSFRSSDRYLPATTDHAFYLTCRGFVTNVFSSIFTKFFSAKIRRQSNKLLLQLFSELAIFLKQHIWKPRNLAFKRWKLERNITSKMLKYKSKNRPSKKWKRVTDIDNARNQLPNQRHPTTVQRPTLVQSHIEVCNNHYNDLFSALNLTDFTNSKELIDARVAYIISTSSNFLHNGPWYNHLVNRDSYLPFSLDTILFFGWGRPLSAMINSAISLRSSRSQSINLEKVKRRLEKDLIEDNNDGGQSIKRKKLYENINNGYHTEEIELDIDTNIDDNNNEYITKELDFDINI
ncbi:ribonuclease H-like domain-containing protein [Rhizophagus clarus]|uniref:Ribonuclease H-like domain-containing protein n=1 Tax=Rhizophagus clarus TaxID=94130 RepID=A0A8H3QP38_9GLOM|nr:ribonuclease H-like domain-containing protein [Rhizophagus clarus]